MTTAVDFVNQLRGLLGIQEQPLGSNYAPPTTDWYADITGYEWARRAAWCAENCTYGLHHCGISAFIYAYCPFWERDARAGVAGMSWGREPQVGALVMYDFDGVSYAEHVGAVESVNDDGTFYTIEGNWSDRCMRLHRDMTYVRGFVYLPFDGQPQQPSEQTSASPTSTGGRPVLRVGSFGDSVKAIQKLAGVEEDGQFGPATEAAVKELQVKLAVDADGVVGPQTYAALDRLLAFLAAQGEAPAEPAPEPVPSGGIAEDGELGPETIKALQSAIGVPVDGLYGDITKAGLQQHLGVDVDGVVGPQTIRALQQRVGVTQDGVWGPQTTLALQQALNAGTF